MRASAALAISEYSSTPTTNPENQKVGGDAPIIPTTERHNIFHTCLESSLPPHEKRANRLGQEGFVAIAAGAKHVLG